MTSEIVWQNLAHAEYDHRQDEHYLVRTPNVAPKHLPGMEWSIITPASPGPWQDAEFTPYKNPNNPTYREAVLFAAEYSVENPGVPVRVERVSLLPRPHENLVSHGPDGAYGYKSIALRAAEDRLAAERNTIMRRFK